MRWATVSFVSMARGPPRFADRAFTRLGLIPLSPGNNGFAVRRPQPLLVKEDEQDVSGVVGVVVPPVFTDQFTVRAKGCSDRPNVLVASALHLGFDDHCQLLFGRHAAAWESIGIVSLFC